MTIEQRLQLTIGFIKQGNTSTENQLVDFLVSQGDTQSEAVNAIPLYLNMMVQFGYIETPTYVAMRDWWNSRTVEQILTATKAMLVEYNALKKAEEDRLEAVRTLEAVNAQIAELEAQPDEILVSNDAKIFNLDILQAEKEELEKKV